MAAQEGDVPFDNDSFLDDMFHDVKSDEKKKKKKKEEKKRLVLVQDIEEGIVDPDEDPLHYLDGHIPIEDTPFKIPNEIREGDAYKGERRIGRLLRYQGVKHRIYWPSDQSVPVSDDNPNKWQNNIEAHHIIYSKIENSELHLKNMLPLASKGTNESVQPVNEKQFPRIFSFIDKMFERALETDQDPPVDERGMLRAYYKDENKPKDDEAIKTAQRGTTRMKTVLIPIGPYKYFIERYNNYLEAKKQKEAEAEAEAKAKAKAEAEAEAASKKDEDTGSQRNTQKQYKKLADAVWKGDKSAYADKEMDPMEELEEGMAIEEEEEEEDSNDDEEEQQQQNKTPLSDSKKKTQNMNEKEDTSDDDEDTSDDDYKVGVDIVDDDDDDDDDQAELMESEDEEEEDEDDDEEEEKERLKDIKRKHETFISEETKAYDTVFKRPDFPQDHHHQQQKQQQKQEETKKPNLPEKQDKPARRTKTMDLKKKQETPSQQQQGNGVKKKDDDKKKKQESLSHVHDKKQKQKQEEEAKKTRPKKKQEQKKKDNKDAMEIVNDDNDNKKKSKSKETEKQKKDVSNNNKKKRKKEAIVRQEENDEDDRDSEEEEEETKPVTKKRKTAEPEGYGPAKQKRWTGIVIPFLRDLHQKFHEKNGKPMPDPLLELTDRSQLEQPKNDRDKALLDRVRFLACILECYAPDSSSWNIRPKKSKVTKPKASKKPSPKKPKDALVMSCFDDS